MRHLIEIDRMTGNEKVLRSELDGPPVGDREEADARYSLEEEIATREKIISHRYGYEIIEADPPYRKGDVLQAEGSCRGVAVRQCRLFDTLPRRGDTSDRTWVITLVTSEHLYVDDDGNPKGPEWNS